MIQALAIFSVIFFVVAFSWAAARIFQSLADSVANLGVGFGWLASFLRGGQQLMINVCGAIMTFIGDAAGAMFAWIGGIAEETYNEIRRHAQLLLEIAEWATGIAVIIAGLRALIHHFTSTNTGTAARVKTLEREYHGIEHQVKQLEREFHGIDETGLRAKLTTLDNEVAKIRAQTIPAIRGQVGTLDGAIGTVEGYLGLPTDLTRPAWLAGIVTVALGAMGLGGLTCGKFKNLLGKFGCGLGTLLNDLLGIMIAGLALEAVCEFLPLFEDAAGLILPPMVNLLNDVPLGACEQVPKSWAQFHVPVGPLPPGQTLGPLPS